MQASALLAQSVRAVHDHPRAAHQGHGRRTVCFVGRGLCEFPASRPFLGHAWVFKEISTSKPFVRVQMNKDKNV